MARFDRDAVFGHDPPLSLLRLFQPLNRAVHIQDQRVPIVTRVECRRHYRNRWRRFGGAGSDGVTGGFASSLSGFSSSFSVTFLVSFPASSLSPFSDTFLFQEWLICLGLSVRQISRAMPSPREGRRPPLTEAAIRMAIKRGSRSKILDELATKIGVPAETLYNISPDDPGVFPDEKTDENARARLLDALKTAAEIRMSEYRKTHPPRQKQSIAPP